MPKFEYKEPNVEAYQVGSDMELPDWLTSVEATWKNSEHPEYKDYRVYFAEGFHPIGFDEAPTHMGFVNIGQWLVKVDIGFPGYGYTFTVMDNEKFECLFEQVQ